MHNIFTRKKMKRKKNVTLWKISLACHSLSFPLSRSSTGCNCPSFVYSYENIEYIYITLQVFVCMCTYMFCMHMYSYWKKLPLSNTSPTLKRKILLNDKFPLVMVNCISLNNTLVLPDLLFYFFNFLK